MKAPECCIELDRSLCSLNFSPDGELIAIGDEFGGLLVASIDGEYIWNANDQGGEVNCVEWSADGSMIAAGAADETVIVYDADGTKLLCINGSRFILGLAWLPSSEGFIFEDDSIHVVDVATSDRRVVGSASPSNCVACSPQGKYFGSGHDDGVLRVWEAMKVRAQPKEIDCHNLRIQSLAWSPSESRCCTGSADARIALVDIDSGTFNVWATNRGGVKSIRWSYDGRHIASGHDDGAVCVWSVDPQQELWSGLHASSTVAVDFHPNSSLLGSVGADGRLLLWNT